MEYCESNLKNFIERGDVVSEIIKPLTKQLLSALNYIHENNIVHLDIKPSNILITKDLIIKIADFGTSRKLELGKNFENDEIITLSYRSPEILLEGSFDHSADVWSMGLVIYEFLNNKILLQGDSCVDQLLRIFRIFGTPNESTWPEFSKLRGYKSYFPQWEIKDINNYLKIDDEVIFKIVSQMLICYPKNRITAKKALEIINS